MKISISDKNIFKYVYAAAIVLNVAAVALIIYFLNNNVYMTMIGATETASPSSIENLNFEKFDKIIMEIERKNKGNELEAVKNLF